MENYREKLKKGYITMEEYRVLAVVLTIEYLKINHEYEFVRKVGQGTYGVVVELKDPCKHHHFAAKIVLEEFVSKSEKEIWPYLCHDNLLPLISMEYITTTYCYVFITPLHRAALNNLVEGSELRKDNKGFEKAISWLHGICSGLQQLHKAKLSHLDIKLSNVLIDDDDRALLCDFGALTRTQAATDRLVINFLRLHA